MHHPIQLAIRTARQLRHGQGAGRATRQAFVDVSADTDVLVIGSHFSDPTSGWIVRDGESWILQDLTGSKGALRERSLRSRTTIIFNADAVRNARAVDDALREFAPVVKLARENITMLARYEHVAAGLRDWKTFSSTSRPWHDPKSVRPEILLTDDPPKHTGVRAVVAERAVAQGAVEDGGGLPRRRRGADHAA